ncbi:putative ubiquitin-conjugating enzyme E2 38 [Cannabis sativa]|uniref:putative ubiquitin-conjugating enzyme E2 38 n=1 Tax=Cannabis sativa TaxID=3483 RepID=UPI0029C9E0FB|nr:putative ubiquitin-conjugating enzyme E2 38 [Cannabis sativa]
MAQNGTELENDILPFKRFDVVSNDSDHYYAKRKNKAKKNDVVSAGGSGAAVVATGEDNHDDDSSSMNDCASATVSQVHKKIMKEWRILERNLPDSIYVRVYENRIDLLRAVIVGAAGTPYHDGLYFFDLAFPSDYPARPPKVHYRSYGLRLNPNLYANGTVCLSLLNTWSGKTTERWNPAESTVLQVLVSIQALVLNERPYFNEPGTGLFGQARWEKYSRDYNRDVFLLCCKTTIHSIRNPPKHFEEFVAAHYRERAKVFLGACRAYANGRVRIGYYRDGDENDVVSEEIYVSKKFVGTMKLIYYQLVTSFLKVGATGIGGHQLKLVKKTTSFEVESNGKNQKKKAFVEKLVTTIKRVFRLVNKKSGKNSNNNAISV